MICPYSFDEPIGSGIPALLDGRYWCMGHIALGMSARRRRCPEDCPVCLGEWGAWRSVVGAVTDLYNEAVESDDEFIPFFVWLDHWRLIHMVAGWSP